MASTPESEAVSALEPEDTGRASPAGGRAEGAQQRCRLSLLLTPLLRYLGDGWRRFQQLRTENSVHVPKRIVTSIAATSATPDSRTKCGRSVSGVFEDLRITVPIVKPPRWTEVERHLQHIPVHFDERGLKETMTVKPHRWNAFVMRQRAKLQAKLQNAIASGKVKDDDVRELQSIVDRMVDWQDLAKYSGKNISMSSTRQGNEMRIHVMAFAERDDGQGVDFMRLEYKKSVDVVTGDAETAKTVESRWIQLMQQPDIAKFTIALAFRQALETEGIDLEFCDAEVELGRT
jgi:hypothetical protein